MNILCCLCHDVNEIGANHFQIDVRNDIHSIRPAARDMTICRRDIEDGVSAEPVSLQGVVTATRLASRSRSGQARNQ